MERKHFHQPRVFTFGDVQDLTKSTMTGSGQEQAPQQLYDVT